jgi:hypothetical protein
VTSRWLLKSTGDRRERGGARFHPLLGTCLLKSCWLFMRPSRPTWFPFVGLFAAVLLGGNPTIARAGLMTLSESRAGFTWSMSLFSAGLNESSAGDTGAWLAGEESRSDLPDDPGRVAARWPPLPIPLPSQQVRPGTGSMGASPVGAASGGVASAALPAIWATRLKPAPSRWLRAEDSPNHLTRQRLKVFRPPRGAHTLACVSDGGLVFFAFSM